MSSLRHVFGFDESRPFPLPKHRVVEERGSEAPVWRVSCACGDQFEADGWTVRHARLRALIAFDEHCLGADGS